MSLDSWDDEQAGFSDGGRASPKTGVLGQWAEVKRLLDEALAERERAEAREARAQAVLDSFIQSEGQAARRAAGHYVQLVAECRFKKETGERCLHQRRCCEELLAEELELMAQLEHVHREIFHERADERELRGLNGRLREVRAARIALKHRTDLPLDALLPDNLARGSKPAASLGNSTPTRTAGSKSSGSCAAKKTKRNRVPTCFVCLKPGVKRDRECPDRHAHKVILEKSSKELEAEVLNDDLYKKMMEDVW